MTWFLFYFFSLNSRDMVGHFHIIIKSKWEKLPVSTAIFTALVFRNDYAVSLTIFCQPRVQNCTLYSSRSTGTESTCFLDLRESTGSEMSSKEESIKYPSEGHFYWAFLWKLNWKRAFVTTRLFSPLSLPLFSSCYVCLLVLNTDRPKSVL